MSAIKKYFNEERQLRMFGLEYPTASDFYLSPWQSNRSPVVLLILRCALFLGSLSMVLSSFILYSLGGIVGFWFIYLTHWGLLLLVFTTGFATAISARCYFGGPINAEFTLPWYVKTYWVLYNIANPITYLITIFYWAILYQVFLAGGGAEELNHGLDIAVHGLNTVVMLLLLVTSRQPTRLLHFYQPLLFGTIYVVFGLIYYYAGGKDTLGNAYVYPVINWENPGPTVGVIILTAVALLVLHLVTAAVALARDVLTARCCAPSVTVHVDEAMPLRHQSNR